MMLFTCKSIFPCNKTAALCTNPIERLTLMPMASERIANPEATTSLGESDACGNRSETAHAALTTEHAHARAHTQTRTCEGLQLRLREAIACCSTRHGRALLSNCDPGRIASSLNQARAEESEQRERLASRRRVSRSARCKAGATERRPFVKARGSQTVGHTRRELTRW